MDPLSEYQQQFENGAVFDDPRFEKTYTDDDFNSHFMSFITSKFIDIRVATARTYRRWEQGNKEAERQSDEPFGGRTEFFSYFKLLGTHNRGGPNHDEYDPYGTHEDRLSLQSGGNQILRHPVPISSILHNKRLGKITPEMKTDLPVLTEGGESLHVDLTLEQVPIFVASYRRKKVTDEEKATDDSEHLPIVLDMDRYSQYIYVDGFDVPVNVFITQEACGDYTCLSRATCVAARRRREEGESLDAYRKRKAKECAACKQKRIDKRNATARASHIYGDDEGKGQSVDHKYWDNEWTQIAPQPDYLELTEQERREAYKPGSWLIHHHAPRMWHGPPEESPCPYYKRFHGGFNPKEHTPDCDQRRGCDCPYHKPWTKDEGWLCKGCELLSTIADDMILVCKKGSTHKPESCNRCLHIKAAHAGGDEYSNKIHSALDEAKYTFASSGTITLTWNHDHDDYFSLKDPDVITVEDEDEETSYAPQRRFKNKSDADRTRLKHIKASISEGGHYNVKLKVYQNISKSDLDLLQKEWPNIPEDRYTLNTDDSQDLHSHAEKVKRSFLALAARLDCHPWAWILLQTARVVFIGIEGCPKSDAMLSQGVAVVSVPAVGQWKTPKTKLLESEIALFIDWVRSRSDAPPLEECFFVIVPDSDWWTKREVVGQARLFYLALKKLGCQASNVLIAAPKVDPVTHLPIFMRNGVECPADPKHDALYLKDKNHKRKCSCKVTWYDAHGRKHVGCIECKGVDDFLAAGGKLEDIEVVERFVDRPKLRAHMESKRNVRTTDKTFEQDYHAAANLIEIAASDGGIPADYRTLAFVWGIIGSSEGAVKVLRILNRLDERYGIITKGDLSLKQDRYIRSGKVKWDEAPCIVVRPEWRGDDLKPAPLHEFLTVPLRRYQEDTGT